MERELKILEKVAKYFDNDVLETEKIYRDLELMMNSCYGITLSRRRSSEITKVIFNNPATIVFWSDGKKTVVKCSVDEAFDEEKGLAMAICKRVLGNQGNYYNEFKKWLPKIDICEDKQENALDKYTKYLRENITQGNARLHDEGDEK